ncbi:hypothetical protein [Halococcus sp. IIIV-5B]|uniref:hypothetical protein n=1 Tax=Halococcus sp. IIIV-5B TaxID=2321230 RepID=UPI0011C40D33|nr:hypothetical protein [Halococcus sp. IIIV-5B]
MTRHCWEGYGGGWDEAVRVLWRAHAGDASDSERRPRIGVRGMSTEASETSEERSRLGRRVACAGR